MELTQKILDQYMPEDIRRLRPFEQQLKTIYEKNGMRTATSAISREKFEQYLKEYSSSDSPIPGIDFPEDETFLMEENYFQTQLDVSVVENARYMPAVTHRHQFFEIACVMSGQVQNFMDEKVMPLHAGDILIMPPGTEHGICTYEDDGILLNLLVRSTTFEHQFMNLIPDDDLLFHFFNQALHHKGSTPYLLFRTGSDTLLFQSLLDIAREFRKSNRYKNTMLSSLLSIFFVNLLRNHEEDVIVPAMQSSAVNKDTVLIIQYMQKNFSTITLKHLAKFFNYSERQMQRIIFAATGNTFAGNILKIRMTNAAGLLKKTDKTISEIAGYLGYYDASSFRHAFRSYYGMTPQAYREQNTR
jgi:AraC family transcriptional activator of pobA